MLSRPPHLRRRPVHSLYFQEEATLLSRGGEYDEVGRWIEGDETSTAITVATAPGGEGAHARALKNEGVAEKDMRMFWITDATVQPVKTTSDGEHSGDRMRYDGVIYRIRAVSFWGTITVCAGVREDPQTEPACAPVTSTPGPDDLPFL